jgi:hypothetical protein
MQHYLPELKNDGEHSEDRPHFCSCQKPGPGTGLLAIIQVSHLLKTPFSQQHPEKAQCSEQAEPYQVLTEL